MAHLVRPTIVCYVERKTGKRVPKGAPGARKVRKCACKWYGQGIPGLPPRKRVPLAADKTAAQTMLADLVRKGERGEAGRIGPDARSLDQGPGARCVDLHHVVDAETAHVPAAPDLKARWGEISQA